MFLLKDITNIIRLTIDSGQQLRQDDPSALKDIIEIVKGKVSIEDGGVT
jgi:nucleolar MIF4G domain-containing protein 1